MAIPHNTLMQLKPNLRKHRLLFPLPPHLPPSVIHLQALILMQQSTTPSIMGIACREEKLGYKSTMLLNTSQKVRPSLRPHCMWMKSVEPLRDPLSRSIPAHQSNVNQQELVLSEFKTFDGNDEDHNGLTSVVKLGLGVGGQRVFQLTLEDLALHRVVISRRIFLGLTHFAHKILSMIKLRISSTEVRDFALISFLFCLHHPAGEPVETMWLVEHVTRLPKQALPFALSLLRDDGLRGNLNRNKSQAVFKGFLTLRLIRIQARLLELRFCTLHRVGQILYHRGDARKRTKFIV
ncbi:uncharacterized protein HD556DRAFT_1539283 [Suillus plorans]|uniref:Uncharacterized protein n=1 Tax=Suillus plorans TaxID=116603 RepID=A0A9P7DB82_9AGAM|nr:uncharacterized protein HD556DRAFT_1539283 [Suillus plorans]KAG1786969.1 hypothetical protein HD556DRAFT_1539283 [Suillus plorans]